MKFELLEARTLLSVANGAQTTEAEHHEEAGYAFSSLFSNIMDFEISDTTLLETCNWAGMIGTAVTAGVAGFLTADKSPSTIKTLGKISSSLVLSTSLTVYFNPLFEFTGHFNSVLTWVASGAWYLSFYGISLMRQSLKQPAPIYCITCPHCGGQSLHQ